VERPPVPPVGGAGSRGEENGRIIKANAENFGPRRGPRGGEKDGRGVFKSTSQTEEKNRRKLKGDLGEAGGRTAALALLLGLHAISR
jgi:hypothetical protein